VTRRVLERIEEVISVCVLINYNNGNNNENFEELSKNEISLKNDSPFTVEKLCIIICTVNKTSSVAHRVGAVDKTIENWITD
jgi:hypothetical protein